MTVNGPGPVPWRQRVREVRIPCARPLIYKRLEAIGQLERLDAVRPAKVWRHAGARVVVREEHRV